MKKKKALLVLCKTALIVLIFACAIFIANERTTKRQIISQYVTSEVTYAKDGSTAYFDDKNFGLTSKGDLLTLHVNLPEDIKIEEGTLAFYIYHSYTDVYFHDRLLYSYGKEIAEKGDMIGNHIYLVDIPVEAWGDEITIVCHLTEDDTYNKIKDINLYRSSDAYQYYADLDFWGYVVSAPLLLLSLVGIFVIILLGKNTRLIRRGFYIAVFALLVALWLITNEGIQQLYGLNDYLFTQLEFFCVMSLPIPIMLYAYETETYSPIKKVILTGIIGDSSFLLIATILNATNIIHYCRVLFIGNTLTFICGVILLVFAIHRNHSKNEGDQVFFNGMTIMFFSGLFDIMRFNIFKHNYFLSQFSFPSLLPIGVVMFILYTLMSYGQEMAANQRKRFTLEHRTEQLQQMVNDIPAGVCVFRMDDDLSLIEANDTYYNILGTTKENAIKAGYTGVLSPFSSEVRKLLLDKVSEIGVSRPISGEEELTLDNVNGITQTILVKYNYIPDNQVVTINIINISERKKMEENLRISEERYKLALSQSGKVYFFFDVPTRTMKLSDELAKVFGLPNELGNMPDSFIATNLVESESINNYRQFYQEIFDGNKTGSTIISCHTYQNPTRVMWYRISFTTIFNDKGEPSNAIIIYEDITEQHNTEITSALKQVNIASSSDNRYSVLTIDLTRDHIITQSGSKDSYSLSEELSLDMINKKYISKYAFADDLPIIQDLLNPKNLIAYFEKGETDKRIEYRCKQGSDDYRWTELNIQMVQDELNGHIIAQLLFFDIHDSKIDQIEMRQNMEELKKELENSRIKVMINQMQPHFLYNALSAIQTIVKVDPDYAYQLIYDFTVHLRSSIKALSSDNPIPFIDELKNIQAYLNIEKMRFGDSLTVNYEIDCENFDVIPLSIQPLAENAARHGVYPKGKDGGTVTIRTYETTESYIVEVEDDGVGFDVNSVMKRNTDSVGLKSLIFRLKSLMNADVTIDSKINQGTKVTVSIPKGVKEDENNSR